MRELQTVHDLEAEDRVRKRHFAAHVSYGTPCVRAMRLCGFQSPSKPGAAALLRDSYVKECVEGCMAELRASLLNSREALVAQLDEAVELAHSLEEPSAMVAGLVAKARVLGFMAEPGAGRGLPTRVTVEWGGESKEITYEKTNPLLLEAAS